MISVRSVYILRARVFASTLYMLPKRVMGLQLFSLARSPDLGMKVIRPLFMWAEVVSALSIAEKARSSIGATSFSNSWKNSMGTPSCPGAFP